MIKLATTIFCWNIFNVLPNVHSAYLIKTNIDLTNKKYFKNMLSIHIASIFVLRQRGYSIKIQSASSFQRKLYKTSLRNVLIYMVRVQCNCFKGTLPRNEWFYRREKYKKEENDKYDLFYIHHICFIYHQHCHDIH